MSIVRVYDPLDVSIIVAGTTLTGLAEQMVEAEQMEDNFTEYVGAKGEVSIAENANKTGTIKITLKNTSPHLAYLQNLAARRKNDAFVPVSIVDSNTAGCVVSGTECRVRKPGVYNANKEVDQVEFEFFVADFQFDPK